MYFKITRGQLTDLIKLHTNGGGSGWHRLEESNIELYNSLSDLGSILSTYYLHSKPNDYILNEWQFNDLMYQTKNHSDSKMGRKKFIDLITLFESEVRDKKIEIILE